MNIIINGTDFWDGFDAMKYWAPPKSYDRQKWKQEIHEYMLSGQYIGARKVDGIWAMIIKDEEGNFHLRSRTKNVEGTYADKAEWIPQILSELEDIPAGTVLLGEIYKYGDEGSRKATAILNCLKNKSLERQAKTPLHFYCFDVLAYGSEVLLKTPIEKRIKYIEKTLCRPTYNFVEKAKYVEGEELWTLCGEILAAGYEGMVIQKKTATYDCGKRTARMTIKVKKEIESTIDAFIDGAWKAPTKEYGGKEIVTWPYWLNIKTGEKFGSCQYSDYCNGAPLIPITRPFYNDWAAAISLSVMKDGKPVHIAWISGITDDVKNRIVHDPESLVGKVVEVSCMQIEHIDGEYSLRHGKILGFRSDKAAEDCTFDQIAIN